jgi:hypothetical protein
LLVKLHFYGNGGLWEDWFRSCLTDRSHKVEVELFFSNWDTLKQEFSIDLCMRINSVSEPVLFTDDTSVIISSRNFKDFCSLSNLVVPHMIE